VILVPELPDAVVQQPTKRTSGWRHPICRKDRLPHRKDRDFCVRILFQPLFECGGPPQTGGSSWREQEDNTPAVGRTVELGLQRVERARCQVHERRLTGWRLVPRQIHPRRER
jgi:hypothetical protein